jgi:putative DNA-invertase from lambdoid prophage Rac
MVVPVTRKRVYCYARSSTDEQADTIQAQADRCRAEWSLRLQAEGYEWGGVYADQGVSGAKAFRSRPQGHALYTALREGDAVVVTKLDRAFRNSNDFFATHERLAARGVRLILLDLQVDTGTPVGRLMLGVLALFADFERGMIRERTAAVLASRRSRGMDVGGRTPAYGLKRVGPKKGRRMEMNDHDREIGARVVQWIDSGWTYESVYWHLLRSRVLNSRGKEWSVSGLQRAYSGERTLRQLEGRGLDRQQVIIAYMEIVHQNSKRQREEYQKRLASRAERRAGGPGQ